VREQLNKSSEARVLAIFTHVCDLVTLDGDVIALVTPGIGNGPLNIVVNAEAGNFASLEPGLAATLQGANLQIGNVHIALDKTTTWEPVPDWAALRNQRAAIVSHLRMLSGIALGSALTENLWPFTSQKVSIAPSDLLTHADEAAQTLRAGWEGDNVQLREGAARLAGLGRGLTPAGDDVLTGVMLWAWVAHPTPAAFCNEIVQVAAPRTTALSAAFLRSAARGECSSAWHQLLAALLKINDDLTASIRQVLAHGATSGADTLAGFLYAAYLSGALSNERLQPGAQK
jgi:hypothetical protein